MTLPFRPDGPRVGEPADASADTAPADTAPAVPLDAAADPPVDAPADATPDKKKPLYPRLLRLRHVHPNAWQRAALGEGALAVAAVLVLADLASAWTLLVLPVAVAVVVKAHDVLAGMLSATGTGEPGS